nr:MAG TPA: fer2-2S iron-sulfur cluster binding domain protein [Caudoviricetes sp.]
MRLGGGSCGACARVAARAVPVHFPGIPLWHY